MIVGNKTKYGRKHLQFTGDHNYLNLFKSELKA